MKKHPAVLPLFVFALVAIALVVSLAGCGKSPTSPSSRSAATHGALGGDGSGGGGSDTTGGGGGGDPVLPTGISGGVYVTDSLVAGGDAIDLHVLVTNHDATAVTVRWRITSTDAWGGLPAEGTLDVAANAVASKTVHVTLPAGSGHSTSAHWVVTPPSGTALNGDLPLWLSAH